MSTNSTEEVGQIYLRAIKKHAPTFLPTAYLGDAAEAFANAAFSVFEKIFFFSVLHSIVEKIFVEKIASMLSLSDSQLIRLALCGDCCFLSL